MLQSAGGLLWAKVGRGCGFEVGGGSHDQDRSKTHWSLLQALESQTSWTGWLTFGAWVTHPSLSVNPETITQSHNHSIVTCGSTVSLSVSCSSESGRLFWGQLISIYQPIRCVCKQYEWERWQMVLQLEYISKVWQSVVDQHNSLTIFTVWQALLYTVLCSLSLSEVIGCHLNSAWEGH